GRTELGGDDHLVAVTARLHPGADYRLGLTARVAGNPAGIDVRRVDTVETGADEGVQDGEGGRLVGRPAEHVAAEDQRRDLEARAAQLAHFHNDLPVQSIESPVGPDHRPPAPSATARAQAFP